MKSVQLFESSMLLGANESNSSTKLATLLHDLATSTPAHSNLKNIAIDAARLRRSHYLDRTLTIENLAELIHLSFFASADPTKRPYPGAGAIYTIQLYIIAYQVEDLSAGVYQLSWPERSLNLIETADKALSFRESYVAQPGKEHLPAIALLVADTQLAAIKYHDRAWRFALLEAGGIMQTMGMAAAQLGLNAGPLGGIADRPALQLCGVAPSEHTFFCLGMALSG